MAKNKTLNEITFPIYSFLLFLHILKVFGYPSAIAYFVYSVNLDPEAEFTAYIFRTKLIFTKSFQ